jgi:hypothetical protein
MLHVTMSGGGDGGRGGGGAFSLSKVHIMTYLEFLFVADKAFRGQNLTIFSESMKDSKVLLIPR